MIYESISFSTYEDFVDEYRKYHMHDCSICNSLREQATVHLDVYMEDKHLEIEEILILQCVNCGEWVLPMHSKQMIDGCYKNTVEHSQRYGLFSPRGYKKQFEYCVEEAFDYDHRDYYNIPGLSYDEEHPVEGFLTPVYFSKNGLYYFLYDSDYKLHLFSETFGRLRYKDDWDVPFGINRKGNVVFWLGDLNYMDKKSLQILKPHNIESDHQLIASEFYAGEMCCTFSEPNKEMRICSQKFKLFKQIKDKYNLELHHLEDEINHQLKVFQKPLKIEESTFEPTVNLLHKVLIEGVNIPELRKLYELFNSDRAKGYKDWRSIKLFQGILKGSLTDDELRDVISPLYLLNDLRQYYDHLLPNHKKNDIKANVVRTLQVESFDCIEDIYNIMLKKLGILFEYLSIVIDESQVSSTKL